jgi:hypothetical protein
MPLIWVTYIYMCIWREGGERESKSEGVRERQRERESRWRHRERK